MPTMSRRNLLAMSAIAPFAGFLLANKSSQKCAPKVESTSSPEQLAVRRMLQERYFPNVPVITQDGKRVRFYDDLIKGKTVVISIFYTQCERACPLIARNLSEVQKMLGDRMGRDVFFVSISIDPREDSPSALKKFARTFHAGPGWTFITGKPGDIEQLRRSLRYADSNPIVDKDKGRHSGMLRVGNEPYTLWTSAQGEAKPNAITQHVNWVLRPTPVATGKMPAGPACGEEAGKA